MNSCLNSCPTPHDCRHCGTQYECTVPDWVCPTLNGDENADTCDECEAKIAEEMQAEWNRDDEIGGEA